MTTILHVNSSKVHPLKQLCLHEDELCFTLLLLSPKNEKFLEMRSKVHPFASKVSSKDELCLHNSVRIYDTINCSIYSFNGNLSA